MAFQGDSIFWVEVEKIVENPFQPRREFDESKLQELAESIRMYGILQPLTVTRKEIQNEDGSFRAEYELIAGERRLRASKIAKLEQVPVIIRSGEQTEQEKLELAIIENLQREDLNAVDRALAFQQLAEAFKLSHAQVAKKVGRSREYVSNSIRLLQLPECMQNSLKLGDISEGHARTLLMLRDKPEEQDVVYREILMKKLSVREVERITRKIAADKVRKKKWNNTDAELIAIEKEFTDTLGTRVQISKTDFGGKLTIDYFSDDDLQKLLLLMKQQEAEAAAEESGESTTVVHELSPEASLAAKLSQAVPVDFTEEPATAEPTEAVLENSPEVKMDNAVDGQSEVPPITPHNHDEQSFVASEETERGEEETAATVPEKVELPSEPESVAGPDHAPEQRHSIPQQEDSPFGQSPVFEEAVTHESEVEDYSAEKTPQTDPVSSFSAGEKTQPASFMPPVVESPTQTGLNEQSPGAEQVPVTEETPAETTPAEVVQSSEFDFIRQQAARDERVLNHQTESAAHTLASASETPAPQTPQTPQASEPAESVAENSEVETQTDQTPVPAEPAPPEEEVQAQKPDDDENLYAMKNFSL